MVSKKPKPFYGKGVAMVIPLTSVSVESVGDQDRQKLKIRGIPPVNDRKFDEWFWQDLKTFRQRLVQNCGQVAAAINLASFEPARLLGTINNTFVWLEHRVGDDLWFLHIDALSECDLNPGEGTRIFVTWGWATAIFKLASEGVIEFGQESHVRLITGESAWYEPRKGIEDINPALRGSLAVMA